MAISKARGSEGVEQGSEGGRRLGNIHSYTHRTRKMNVCPLLVLVLVLFDLSLGSYLLRPLFSCFLLLYDCLLLFEDIHTLSHTHAHRKEKIDGEEEKEGRSRGMSTTNIENDSERCKRLWQ